MHSPRDPTVHLRPRSHIEDSNIPRPTCHVDHHRSAKSSVAIPAFLSSHSGEGNRNGSFMREEPLTSLDPPERWMTLKTEPGQRAWNFNEFVWSQDIALTERSRWLTGQWIACSYRIDHGDSDGAGSWILIIHISILLDPTRQSLDSSFP